MVATERKLRAEAEEELSELKREKEALRSALVLVEGENTNLRLASPQPASGPSSIGNSPQVSIGGSSTSFTRAHERSASQIAIKSRPRVARLLHGGPVPAAAAVARALIAGRTAQRPPSGERALAPRLRGRLRVRRRAADASFTRPGCAARARTARGVRPACADGPGVDVGPVS